MQNDDRLLPVELIHQIFDYLSTIDILQSFSNLNYYFDNILSNYNRYHVDFQSCLKRNFHRIYSRLQSNQILSLILSNKDDTPNQFQFIFSQNDTHPSHIFTVPRSASTHAYYSKHSSFSIPAYSTISFDQTLFYDHINHLTILNEFILSQRFMHVKILSIKNLKLINRLQFVVDLNQIQCLKLIDTITTHDLEQLISNKFPRIYELHLCTLSNSYHRQLNGIKQILTLYIQTVNNSSQLCRQFPCIERLYIEHVKSYRQIRYILHHLKSHLSCLSLSWSFGHQSKRSFQLTRNLIQRNQQEFNSIYRYHNQHRSTLHLWIDSSTEQVRLSNTTITNVFRQWLLNGLSWLSRY